MRKSHASGAGALNSPLPALDDAEGKSIPAGMPFVIDAHVHLFPGNLFEAIWQWFDRHGWPIRYRLSAGEIVEFLTSRGIGHIVALQYAHKPGVARGLNQFLAGFCRRHATVTGLATVYPGEPAAAAILEEAFEAGLSGLKLHNHVQCFELAGPEMLQIYDICSQREKPLLMHVGREPKSPAYPCDPYELCRADKVEAILKQFPKLKICVPHLGADEFDAYRRLIEVYDSLWLDTTMTLGGYLPFSDIPDIADLREDRVMYGTDFPNLPYAWDREIKAVAGMALAERRLKRLLGENAAEFYGIENRHSNSQGRKHAKYTNR
jgi:predicted TIM-barrel fold metal-dependent hydrolase